MERKIGEIFEYNGEWYQCINGFECTKCDLHQKGRCTARYDNIGSCSKNSRKDNTPIIFKKLEKIGEPYDDCGAILQKFKIYTNVTNADTKGLELHIYSNDTIGIEIKQDRKEVMEIDKVVMNIDDRDYLLDRLEAILHDTHCQQYKDEICEAFSKYIVTENVSDLKPFNLDAAKAGKPVCTRNGKRARIICFDAKYDLPIVALITEDGGKENLIRYNSNGRYTNLNKTDCDLMMLSEKKIGWINVYRDYDEGNITKDDNIYSLKDAAIASAQMIDKDNYVATVKINWDE